MYQMLLCMNMNETVSINSDGCDPSNPVAACITEPDWYVERDVRSYLAMLDRVENPDVPPDASIEEVLSVLGATVEIDGRTYPTEAGLLMFGKAWLISRWFYRFDLDYVEDVGGRTYDYRLTSLDYEWGLNVFRFLIEVTSRLTMRIGIPFELNGWIRRGDSDVLIVVREALVNALAHADHHNGRVFVRYQGNRMVFSNPGRMRVPLSEAKAGGACDPRNPVLMGMLRRIGKVRMEGNGIRSIFDAVENGTILSASVKEDCQIVFTEIAFVPLGRKPEATDLAVLRYVSENPNASVKDIASMLGVCAKTAGRILDGLAESGRLRNAGAGRKNVWVVGIRGFLATTVKRSLVRTYSRHLLPMDHTDG